MKQAVKSASRRSKEDLKWIRPPSQKRSREALEAILDAAQGLIEDRLFDEVTVAEICEAANCSLPGFYRRFRDKEALLHALHARHTEAAIATSEEALDPERWDGDPISKVLESLFDLMTSADYRASGLRVTASQRATKDDLFAERIRAIRSVVYLGMRRLLILRREEYRHPDPELAAKFLVKLTYGVLTGYFGGGDEVADSVHPLSDQEIKSELLRTALAYLDVVDSSLSAKN